MTDPSDFDPRRPHGPISLPLPNITRAGVEMVARLQGLSPQEWIARACADALARLANEPAWPTPLRSWLRLDDARHGKREMKWEAEELAGGGWHSATCGVTPGLADERGRLAHASQDPHSLALLGFDLPMHERLTQALAGVSLGGALAAAEAVRLDDSFGVGLAAAVRGLDAGTDQALVRIKSVHPWVRVLRLRADGAVGVLVFISDSAVMSMGVSQARLLTAEMAAQIAGAGEPDPRGVADLAVGLHREAGDPCGAVGEHRAHWPTPVGWATSPLLAMTPWASVALTEAMALAADGEPLAPDHPCAQGQW